MNRALALALLLLAAVPAAAQERAKEPSRSPEQKPEAKLEQKEDTRIWFRLGGERVSKRVKSFKELREEGVVLQKLDYSCGAAAIATLLTAFFDDKVSEDEVIGFIFLHGQTPEEGLKRYFRRKGFSLLDLKRFAEFRGYKAAGYKEMTLEDLIEILRDQRVPLLAPISPFGYNHFVVVLGIQGNRMYLADPAIGRSTMLVSRFLDAWVDGIGFVVAQKSVARAAQVRDDELARITAAGDPSRPAAGGPAVAGGAAPLLTSGFAVPDLGRLAPVLNRQPSRAFPSALPVITDPFGRDLLAIFPLNRYNPSIGFGRPEGNFLDFSPTPGQELKLR